MLIATFTLIGGSKFTLEFEDYDDVCTFACHNKETILYISIDRKPKGDNNDNKGIQR